MKTQFRMWSTVTISVLLAACSTARTVSQSGGDVALVRPGVLHLKEGMRRLWTDHVVWTREYINAAVAGDASASAVAARLMKNQEDIGRAIEPYYGNAASTKLTELLKQHIGIAVDLVAAAKASDNAKVADADRRWHDNARDIAAFLSSANPHWPQETLKMMMDEHLRLTTSEATTRIQKRWAENAAVFDQILNQAISMADALTDGIAKQFPSKV
jgi:hypothetical protein